MTGSSVYRTEAEWMVDVRAVAGRFGWLCWHHLRSEGTRAGLPDLELAHPGGQVGVHVRVELKTDRHDSHLSPAQVVTLDVLARCTPWSWLFVWRPSDRDEIDHILARRGLCDGATAGTSWRNPERRIREVRRLSDSELGDVIRIGRDAGIVYRTTDVNMTPDFR